MWFMVCRWPQSQEGDWTRDTTTFMQICSTWALVCLETAEQRPCVMREIETWLSDSRVSYNRVVDHRSWWPVLSALHSCVDRCHVWRHWTSGASHGGGRSKTSACTGQFEWAFIKTTQMTEVNRALTFYRLRCCENLSIHQDNCGLQFSFCPTLSISMLHWSWLQLESLLTTDYFIIEGTTLWNLNNNKTN